MTHSKKLLSSESCLPCSLLNNYLSLELASFSIMIFFLSIIKTNCKTCEKFMVHVFNPGTEHKFFNRFYEENKETLFTVLDWFMNFYTWFKTFFFGPLQKSVL